MLESLITFIDEYALLVVFFTALIDSLPFGGFIVPEEALLAIVGFAAASGRSELLVLFGVAALAMIAGQLMVYKIGDWYGEKVIGYLNLSQDKQLVIKKLIFEQNFLTNIIARFSSTLRSAIGLLAGTYKVELKRFMSIEILISLIKSALFLSLGYFFGESTGQVQSLVGKISVMLIVITVLSFVISTYVSKTVWK